MNTEHYNYEIFPPEDDVEAFRGFASHLKVDDAAPDPELTALDNEQAIRLSEHTSYGLTVVEFGSLT